MFAYFSVNESCIGCKIICVYSICKCYRQHRWFTIFRLRNDLVNDINHSFIFADYTIRKDENLNYSKYLWIKLKICIKIFSYI